MRVVKRRFNVVLQSYASGIFVSNLASLDVRTPRLVTTLRLGGGVLEYLVLVVVLVDPFPFVSSQGGR